MPNNLKVITDNYIATRIIMRVAINGAEFDDEFLAGLFAMLMNQRGHLKQPPHRISNPCFPE